MLGKSLEEVRSMPIGEVFLWKAWILEKNEPRD